MLSDYSMGEDGPQGHIITIQPSNIRHVKWFLSPSKSHMIRWLLLASMSKGKTVLSFSGEPGDDIHSMANCLGKLGVKIEKEEDKWTVFGNGPEGISLPNEILDCRNSGTTMRFLIAQAACFSSTVIIDGDWTLRNRHLSSRC